MGEQLTPNDVKKIKEEIEYRKLVVRKKELEAVKEARAQGDLSENFEYKAAKQDKNRNESRIRYLERMLKHAKIVSDQSAGDEVGINNTVDLYFEDDEEVEETKTKVKESSNNSTNGGKMILLEPRAYSESQQIADHLKKKNTVVVNMKRVTPDQAKRIVDFLSGTVYALGGDLQKIGGGIFLCTPKNVNVEGAITDDDDKSKKSKNDIDLDW